MRVRDTQPCEWIVRQASQADEKSMRRLMQRSQRVALRFRRPNLGSHLASEPFLLAEQAGRLRGFLAFDSRPLAHASLVAAGLDDDCSLSTWLDRLLNGSIAFLRSRRHLALSYVGSAEWLIEPLQDRNFRLLDHIIAYETTDLSVPHTGNPAVEIRPLRSADFGPLVALDVLDFDPIWRNSHETLEGWKRTLPYFVVATLGDNLVGYCSCALMAPGHGHLVRMAVHPAWQSLGIGSRLVAEAARFFREAGAHRVTLNTQERNERAQWLYQSFGFRPKGREAVALWRDL